MSFIRNTGYQLIRATLSRLIIPEFIQFTSISTICGRNYGTYASRKPIDCLNELMLKLYMNIPFCLDRRKNILISGQRDCDGVSFIEELWYEKLYIFLQFIFTLYFYPLRSYLDKRVAYTLIRFSSTNTREAVKLWITVSKEANFSRLSFLTE